MDYSYGSWDKIPWQSSPSWEQLPLSSMYLHLSFFLKVLLIKKSWELQCYWCSVCCVWLQDMRQTPSSWKDVLYIFFVCVLLRTIVSKFFSFISLLLVCFVVPGIKPSTSHVQSKCSTSELHFQSSFMNLKYLFCRPSAFCSPPAGITRPILEWKAAKSIQHIAYCSVMLPVIQWE